LFCSEKDRDAAGKRAVSRLYAIIDSSYVTPEDIPTVAEKILASGVRTIQLRMKKEPYPASTSSGEFLRLARELRGITKKFDAKFIVNDRIDIALMSEADGVHIGLEDIPPEEARKLLGPDRIIGYSTHTVEEALYGNELAKSGVVDYISIGPIFPTKTKKDASKVVGLELLRAAADRVTVPITAIGGITEENLDSVLTALASNKSGVALISEILLATDIDAKITALLKIISKHS
jgi:thiamine-phosphate pyrophosphorylase